MTAGEGNSLVTMLSLQGERFHSLALDVWVNEIEEFANGVLAEPRMTDYVDHGMDHSRRVIKRALEAAGKLFPSDRQLSPLERAVLGVAALIHDIGMQYNKYRVRDKQLSEAEVRDRHCELGAEMLKAAAQEGAVPRGLPDLHVRQEYAFLLHYMELVAFSHCSRNGQRFWASLPAPGQGRPQGGETVRLPLLAALIRLSDEMDQDFRRIKDFNRIHSSLLGPESKAHWCACYYVRAVELKGGPGVFMVHLHWMTPDNDMQCELVRSLLERVRQDHLNEELKVIAPYLVCNSAISEPSWHAKIAEEPERNPHALSLPTSVIEYVQREFPFRYGQKHIAQYANFGELKGGTALEHAKSRADDFVRSGKGVIGQHFVLGTGWHTNRYVMCRELVADPIFAEELATALAESYEAAGIDHVVAIGTSAIRIATLAALKLGAELPYAYGGIQVTGESSHVLTPHDFGKHVVVRRGAHVLLIDDILGVGSVLLPVLKSLRSMGVSSIRVFCIYSLGDSKSFVEELGDVDVRYLVAFPDVKYWRPSDDEMCEVCRGKPEIRNYEELRSSRKAFS